MIRVFLIYGLLFIVISQIIVPIFVKDLPIFWMFRKYKDSKSKRVFDELNDVMNEHQAVAEKLKAIQNQQRQQTSSATINSDDELEKEQQLSK